MPATSGTRYRGNRMLEKIRRNEKIRSVSEKVKARSRVEDGAMCTTVGQRTVKSRAVNNSLALHDDDKWDHSGLIEARQPTRNRENYRSSLRKVDERQKRR